MPSEWLRLRLGAFTTPPPNIPSTPSAVQVHAIAARGAARTHSTACARACTRPHATAPPLLRLRLAKARPSSVTSYSGPTSKFHPKSELVKLNSREANDKAPYLSSVPHSADNAVPALLAAVLAACCAGPGGLTDPAPAAVYARPHMSQLMR